MKKIILVDGNNLLFRSFFATSYSGVIMRNSKGFPTNALYGFINMLNKIIQEENPEYILVALDHGKTFRHEKYEQYKGKREEMPLELKEQFPVAKEVMDAMGISYLEVDHFEADDIIGTYAKRINQEPDCEGLIVSSDKDLLQLITPKVKVKLLKQSGHIMMDEEEFRKTYHVDPIGMIDLKALMGDPSDNIPGVKGIGEKTAIRLLEEYHTLDNLYANLDQIKGATHDKLAADKVQAYASQDLATIYQDIDIDTDLEKIRYRHMDPANYLKILQRLEFHSLIKKIPKPLLKQAEKEEMPQEKNTTPVIVLDTLENFSLEGDYAIYTEIVGANYHYDEIVGITLYQPGQAYFIKPEVVRTNPSFFQSDNVKYTYDLKKLMVVLKRLGATIQNCSYDAMIAGYLLNYNVKEDIAYLAHAKDFEVGFYEAVYGKNAKLKKPEDALCIADLIAKCQFIYETKEEFLQEIDKEGDRYLFESIEMPLVEVLEDMETTGIRVDQEYLTSFGEELKEEFTSIEKEIYQLAGIEFNISSPKQLANVLFERLQIPYPKKIKDQNYSTSKEILDKISDYAIVEKVLRYRTLTKIYTTYVVGMIDEIHDGRVHTIFNQTLTRTGRLSSVMPNLQNIPIRLEEGKRIRKAFIPDEDSYLLSSDYSQIELRIFASLSNAENMIHAFQNDDDIHARTASDIFHVPIEEVTKDMRRTAKAVNFGIIYGISSFGLSEDLKIDVTTAKKFIEGYLNAYPGIRDYMDTLIRNAYRDGYVKTIMGRKRTIEELKNKNYAVRSSGERMALNTPIQGSSADILKKAMIEIYREFQKQGLQSKMLIQVHDELVFNVKKEEMDIVQKIVKEKMENVYQFKVPLKVDIEFGVDWYDAK